jgi:catechol 2,3-dioxygenase-like lactoylglutathione lyase family enzyme
MKFICTLVAVEEIARSRKLYEGILGQKVTAEFGDSNLAFEGGLAFYKKSLYHSLIGGRPIQERANNFELYFEEDDLEGLAREIAGNGFEFLHAIQEEPWKQRDFRFYDTDGHIVVIAESMEQVSYRLSQAGNSVEEITRMTGEPAGQVEEEIRSYTAGFTHNLN